MTIVILFIYKIKRIYPWGVWFLRNLWGVKKSYFRIIESYADIWLAPNQTHWISPNNTNSPHPLPHIKTISFFAGHFHFSLYSVFSPLPCILCFISHNNCFLHHSDGRWEANSCIFVPISWFVYLIFYCCNFNFQNFPNVSSILYMQFLLLIVFSFIFKMIFFC
jgi:hypothetical protein